MKLLRIMLLPAVLLGCTAWVQAQNIGTARLEAVEPEYIQIFLGESFKLSVQEVQSVVVSDPEIVEIIPVTAEVLVLNAKKPGTAILTLFEATGERTIRVVVTQNDVALALRIKDAIGYPDVSVLVAERNIILEGEVEDSDERNRAVTIAGAFLPAVRGAQASTSAQNVYNTTQYPEGDNTSEGDVADAVAYRSITPEGIFDFLRIRNQRQIRLRVQVVRVNNTAAKNFGLQYQESVGYGVGYNEIIAGPALEVIKGLDGRGGGQNWLGDQLRGLGHGAVPLDDGFTLNGQFEGPTGSQQVNVTQAYTVTLNLLENKGLAKTLARPVLTTLDGAEASFLSGGKAILATTAVVGGVLSTTTQTEEFGVKVFFRPKIMPNGNVQLFITPKVTELPQEFGERGSFLIPSRNTRNNVELPNNTTMILSGLFEVNENLNIAKFPWLGDIPILGELFRNRQKENLQQEIFFFVTPQIVESPRLVEVGPAMRPEFGETKVWMDEKRVFQTMNPDYAPKGPRLSPREVKAPINAPGAPGVESFGDPLDEWDTWESRTVGDVVVERPSFAPSAPVPAGSPAAAGPGAVEGLYEQPRLDMAVPPASVPDSVPPPSTLIPDAAPPAETMQMEQPVEGIIPSPVPSETVPAEDDISIPKPLAPKLQPR